MKKSGCNFSSGRYQYRIDVFTRNRTVKGEEFCSGIWISTYTTVDDAMLSFSLGVFAVWLWARSEVSADAEVLDSIDLKHWLISGLTELTREIYVRVREYKYEVRAAVYHVTAQTQSAVARLLW